MLVPYLMLSLSFQPVTYFKTLAADTETYPNSRYCFDVLLYQISMYLLTNSIDTHTK